MLSQQASPKQKSYNMCKVSFKRTVSIQAVIEMSPVRLRHIVSHEVHNSHSAVTIKVIYHPDNLCSFLFVVHSRFCFIDFIIRVNPCNPWSFSLNLEIEDHVQLIVQLIELHP